ncbi:YihY/virulence factor BrkB family protein [Roseibium salinum]|nr:YihY/virulence factor BrkB family protein [Roseibium salinum]
MAGWKDILYRVWDAIGTDHISLVAAGVAFYGLLAIFPAVTALMAIAGLVIEPAQVADQLELLATFVPQQAATIILDQAASVAGSQEASLGIAFIVSLGLAIFSASRGMASLMEGLNLAYDEYETRGLILRFALNLGLTVLLVLALLLGGSYRPWCCRQSSISCSCRRGWLVCSQSAAGSSWLCWRSRAFPSSTASGPAARMQDGRGSRREPWLPVSSGWSPPSDFSVYVANFGSYNQTFGSLAGVIILLMWLWLSAYIVLLGAELNGEMEAQTRKDSTTGPEQPMGLRGAVKADVLGKSVAASD